MANNERWRDIGHALNKEPGRDASPATKDPFLRLAGAVLTQCYRDLGGPDGETMLECLYFLASPVAVLMTDNLGMPDPLVPVGAGSYRNIERRRPKANKKAR